MATRLLRPAAVAQYLGVSRGQLYLLGVLLELPPVKLGDSKLYDVRDLDAWIDRHKAEQRTAA
jgi:predicted DNA-binding transcriptional regulator AlpA